MTKKKALKMIMTWGVQRNEAQKRLLNLHRLGLNNQQAVFLIRFSSGFVSAKKFRELFDFVGTTADECAKSFHILADEMEEFANESAGD